MAWFLSFLFYFVLGDLVIYYSKAIKRLIRQIRREKIYVWSVFNAIVLLMEIAGGVLTFFLIGEYGKEFVASIAQQL
jgi:hypothetical protein